MNIDFIDLKAQQRRLKSDIDTNIAAVLEHGRYIMGPEVGVFEGLLAEFGEAQHALSCGNGTDALLIPLLAWDIGRGDAVFCPSFTFCATAEIIAQVGASPVFIDIDRDTYNIDAGSLRRAVEQIIADGKLTPRAVISVDLFGQSADYEAITPIIQEYGLKLIADSAQSFGTTLKTKHPLNWADVATTSFFPAKPLGCYGDGGAMLTNDAELAEAIKSLRCHGQGSDKYDNVRIGVNSRLDTLQAAILIAKLSVFLDEIEKRNHIANRYIEGLRSNVLRVPHVPADIMSTWAQFTIEVPDPDHFSADLRAKGIPTARYYPKPIHMQTAYQHYPCAEGGLPNTMDCIENVISLPMHPYLEPDVQDKIIEASREALL